MPPIVAAAAVTAAGALAGGKLAANASGKAARLQTDAANHGADLQKQSTDESLAFQKEQEAANQARWEASQRANYGQYVSRAKAAQGLGDSIGFHLPDPAAYESSQPGGQPSGTSGAGGGAAPSVSAANGDIGQQVSAYFKARGVPDTETPYWVEKWTEFGARDPEYFNRRLAQADIFGGGGSTGIAPSRTVAGALPGRSRMAVPTPEAGDFRLRSINAFTKA